AGTAGLLRRIALRVAGWRRRIALLRVSLLGIALLRITLLGVALLRIALLGIALWRRRDHLRLARPGRRVRSGRIIAVVVVGRAGGWDFGRRTRRTTENATELGRGRHRSRADKRGSRDQQFQSAHRIARVSAPQFMAAGGSGWLTRTLRQAKGTQ